MKPISITICVLLSVSCYAQNASIKGSVRDTLNNQNLSNSVIALLFAKDSVLHSFTRSDKDGNFELSKIPKGQYLLMITHPKFADYLDHLTLDSTSSLDLGKLLMTTKARLLEEVIVQQKIAAVRMRGDTVEYKADSFKVREGASVEEMLKRLPGVIVDKDGKITAQGQKVEKVLVDGEEFFGDDPTIATKNLSADAIDKVQVFDKKSDQATFSGIDDGDTKRTINLKMKEDKKRGYFGKLDLGAGPDDKWNNSAMINRFKGKQKISGFGVMSSTGATGLNWEDDMKYGNKNPEYNEEMGYFSMGDDGGDFDNGSFNGQGLPKSWAAALNYSDKFNADKQSVNGSYRYNKLNSEGQSSTLTQSILPGGSSLISKDASNSFNSRQKHSANGTYEYQIDSGLSVKLKANGSLGQFNESTNYQGRTSDILDSTINKSDRSTSAIGNRSNLNANLILRKKFKKIGRTFSLDMDEKYNSESSTGFLHALITTYDPVTRQPKDSLTDQKKVSDSRFSIFGAKASFTEPLSKKLFMEVSYAFRVSNSNSEKLSYDKSDNGKYESLSEAYSSKYVFDIITNTAGLSFKYNTKKVTVGAGSSMAFQNFNQKNLFTNTSFNRHYVNLFPKANFSYKFSAYSRITVGYSGYTQQPSIFQIQPIANNSNPLEIWQGNPLLKQEFVHNVNFNYNTYKMESENGMYIYGNVSTTANNISNTQNTDTTTGKTTYRYINTNGNMYGYAGASYFMKLKKLDARLGAELSLNYAKQTSFINQTKNVTQTYTPGANLNFGKDKEKKYNFSYSPGINYNISNATVNTNGINTNYWTHTERFNATVYLKWKLEVNSDVNATFRQKTVTFDNNNNVVLWNAYIGRKLLKDDKAIIKLNAFDILNQNRGYSRYVSTTMQTENNYQTLTRYFTLSFVWNFSKSAMGNVTPKP